MASQQRVVKDRDSAQRGDIQVHSLHQGRCKYQLFGSLIGLKFETRSPEWLKKEVATGIAGEMQGDL